ncbi:cupin domain-containing protein [Paenarthrobacter sp. NEAU-H11]|uniref:cupin domain-containing protein n=1 Tax=Paenarthrobacter sp. NEAU-H11 TaxID=3423924 RepID=UPI003D3581CD
MAANTEPSLTHRNDGRLKPGHPLDVRKLELEPTPVPVSQIADGAPTTSLLRLGAFENLMVGVWEMSAGAVHDVEVEEIFVVISGSATVELHHDGGASLAKLAPGSLMRLSKGTRTTWTVHETLRKVYLNQQLR